MAKEFNNLVLSLKKADCRGKMAACFFNRSPSAREGNSLGILLGLLDFD